MTFDLQPNLTGQLIHLRPLVAKDFDELRTVAADPLIWEQHPVPRYKPDVFRAFFVESLALGGTLVTSDAVTHQMIGSSRYHNFSQEKREVEIGWTFLARSHWGGRYNGEMKQLMIAHAFRFVDRVVFLVAPTNFRSQRAVEKIGGIRAGSRPDASGQERFAYVIHNEKSVGR